MVKTQAKVTDDGRVEVSLTAEGVAADVLEESAAIIKSLYEDISQHETLVEPFVATIGEIVLDWMREIEAKRGESKNYA